MAEDGPLFIVDNAPGGRTGLDYLREWSEIATKFDIATGYFDIGALIALDGHWQRLEGLRILMGDEVGAGTKKALLAAVKARAVSLLDESLEAEKEADPFGSSTSAATTAARTRRRTSSPSRRRSPSPCSSALSRSRPAPSRRSCTAG